MIVRKLFRLHVWLLISAGVLQAMPDPIGPLGDRCADLIMGAMGYLGVTLYLPYAILFSHYHNVPRCTR